MKLQGRTLPEWFFARAQNSPQTEFFFTKRNGQWKGMTYERAFTFVRQTIAGLQALGFSPGDTVCILSENREEWILTDYAAQWLGGKTTAIYTTNTPEQIRYVLEESETKVLFVSNAQLMKRFENLTSLSQVKAIVMWDAFDAKTHASGVSIVQRSDFLKGEISVDVAREMLNRLNPEDLCILLYTSGTTGEPKGVMLTHANIVSNIHAMLAAVPVQEGKVTVSFLPLSHIYERVIHNVAVFRAIRTYFAESMDKIVDNIQEIRPQMMTSVPRIFEKMYMRIQERIKNASHLQKKIFALALGIGRKTFSYHYRRVRPPLFWRCMDVVADILVFKKIRAITGGRAELFISGGAPLSTEIMEFFFSCRFLILEGYGLSETCILSVNREERFKFGTVGYPFDGIEMKIASDGEILVRGPSVMKGYYKKPEDTAAVLSSDGWFHTGDIGEIDAEGFVKITDRKKDLIITAGGKKVAPQPIENTLKQDPLIENICLVGDQKKYITALIVPNLSLCETWGAKKGENLKTLEDCVRSAKLRDHFWELLSEVNQGLPPFSTIKNFTLLSRVFSQETGELTPTLKLKRREVQKIYASVIDSMYQG